MINDFIETFCKNIIAQIRIPRKGVIVILFILTSVFISINKLYFHYSIAPKDSLLLQILYGLWFYSIAAICIKAYNEYCDKKDAQKAEEEKLQKARERVNEYFEMFDYCDNEEKKILKKFYTSQKTSIYVNNVAVVRAMNLKGIKFLTCEGSFDNPGKALISSRGLKIITKYFKNK